MTKVEQYKKAKQEMGYSISWADMIGKSYSGGGGGIGSVTTALIGNAIVYHQEYDGAKNYWEIPDGLRPFLNQVLKHEMKALAEKALSLQMAELERLANDAQKELREAMKDAGLDVIDSPVQPSANEGKV